MSDILPTISRSEGIEVAVTEYETIPAVGGGVITRPRVFHTTSLAHSATSNASSHTSRLSTSRLTTPALHRLSQSLSDVRPSSSLRNSHLYSPPSSVRRDSWESSGPPGDYFTEGYAATGASQPSVARGFRQATVEDDETSYANDHGVAAASTRFAYHAGSDDSSPRSVTSSGVAQLDSRSASGSPRRNSNNSRIVSHGSAYSDIDRDADSRIVIRPGLNNAVSQLSLLNRSNHTLSPYTRTLEHFTIRSVPPKPVVSPGLPPADKHPPKAKRKRMYRLGGTGKGTGGPLAPVAPPNAPPPHSPIAPSEFDMSDVDRYFPSHDDEPLPTLDEILTPHIRHRPLQRNHYDDHV